MKKKILLALLTALLLLTVVLSGCGGSGGVPQADYDKVTAQLKDVQAQLADAQSKLTKAQADLAALQTVKPAADTDLKAAQAQVAALQKQVSDLKAKYEYTGLTTEQKVVQLIKNYYDAHNYMEDIYDCNDMSGDIWNMLKKQGINSLLAVGNIDMPITDIAQSNHAWVLAEITPGTYLALETTLGTTVARKDNGGYYRGWSFKTPADVIKYQEIFAQYNILVDYRNTLAAGNYAALLSQVEQKLNSLKAQYEALVTVIK
jgi:hypothetical protein